LWGQGDIKQKKYVLKGWIFFPRPSEDNLQTSLVMFERGNMIFYNLELEEQQKFPNK
jgi:hypothetical protein